MDHWIISAERLFIWLYTYTVYSQSSTTTFSKLIELNIFEILSLWTELLNSPCILYFKPKDLHFFWGCTSNHPVDPVFFAKEVMADAAENPTGRLRAGSGEVLDAVDLAEELDFDDEAGGHQSRWL